MRNDSVILLVTLLTMIILPITANAQSAKERRDQLSEKQLQLRAERAEEALLKELTEIAVELQKQGQREQCLTVLERIEHINPSVPGVKEKISLIREELISENGTSFDLDTSKGWGGPVVEVESGKPFRIAVTGDYRLNINAILLPTGISTEDPSRDPVREAPFGSVIGLIVTDGKPGTPFNVGAGLEMTPKKSGTLFLRTNVPLAAKCTGTLKVQLSGSIRSLSSRR